MRFLGGLAESEEFGEELGLGMKIGTLRLYLMRASCFWASCRFLVLNLSS